MIHLKYAYLKPYWVALDPKYCIIIPNKCTAQKQSEACSFRALLKLIPIETRFSFYTDH